VSNGHARLRSTGRANNEWSSYVILLKSSKAVLPRYNRRHGRYGAFWAERFKSLLLEGGQAVATVAAYIDLNPVRAALCADPKDYPYCGYAAPICLASDMSQ
jgi:hypothetical protein